MNAPALLIRAPRLVLKDLAMSKLPRLLLWLGLCAAPLAHAALSVNANGTVTDSDTGLVWDQCTYGLSGAGCATGSAFNGTWPDALRQATNANADAYKGTSDWRVPSKNELESIVKIDKSGPTIDSTAFPGTPMIARLWTSTTYALLPANAWGINFNDGEVDYNTKTEPGYVRLVRGGQSPAAFDGLSGADSTAPTTTAAPAISSAPTHNSAGVSVTINEAGTGYWLLLPSSAAAPTAAQVVAGANSLGLAANTAATINVTGLSASTAYTLYFVAKDVSGNLQSAPSSVAVTTTAAPQPPGPGPGPAPISGICGSATAITVLTAPSANLCSTGTPSSVSATAAAFDWGCAGSHGGSSAQCSAPRQYAHAVTATAQSIADGTATCSLNSVAQGASVTCTATAKAGYMFKAWTGACAGQAASCSLSNVTAPQSSVAVFQPLNLTLAEGPHQGQALGLVVPPNAANWVLQSASIASVVSTGTSVPSGVQLPHGVVNLTLGSGTAGSAGTSATVVLTYPQPLPVGTKYYQFGQTAANPANHWHAFSGAVITGNTITLTIQDGGEGDNDLTANGVIQVLGGPAVLVETPPAPTQTVVSTAGPFTITNPALPIVIGPNAAGATLVLPGTGTTPVSLNVQLGGQQLQVQALPGTQLQVAQVGGQSVLVLVVQQGWAQLSSSQANQPLVLAGDVLLSSGSVGTRIEAVPLATGVLVGSLVPPTGAVPRLDGRGLLAGERLQVNAQGDITAITLGTLSGLNPNNPTPNAQPSSAATPAGDPVALPDLGAHISFNAPPVQLQGSVQRLLGESWQQVLHAKTREVGDVLTPGAPTGMAWGTQGSALLRMGHLLVALLPQGPVHIDTRLADGAFYTPEGQVQFVRRGLVLTLSPTVADWPRFAQALAALPPEAGVKVGVTTQGVLLLTLNNERWALRPALLAQATAPATSGQSTPGIGNDEAPPHFSTDADNTVVLDNGQGLRQSLLFAFADYAALRSTVEQALPGARVQALLQPEGALQVNLPDGGGNWQLRPEPRLPASCPVAQAARQATPAERWWVDPAGLIHVCLPQGVAQGVHTIPVP